MTGARPPAVYLAGPDGFTPAGLRWHREVLLPTVQAAGLEPLSPWASELDELAHAALMPPGPKRRQRFAEINYAIGGANAAMIDRAQGVLAVLDGPDVDSGTAAEIGYAAKAGLVVVGLRSDVRRSGDNEGSTVNLQVDYFIRASGGSVHDRLEPAVAALASLLGGGGP